MGIRFGNPGIVKTFLKTGLPGIYFAVVEEGVVGPGDTIELLHTDQRRITVRDMLALVLDRHAPESELQRLLAIPGLASVWREEIQARLGG